MSDLVRVSPERYTWRDRASIWKETPSRWSVYGPNGNWCDDFPTLGECVAWLEDNDD